MSFKNPFCSRIILVFKDKKILLLGAIIVLFFLKLGAIKIFRKKIVISKNKDSMQSKTHVGEEYYVNTTSSTAVKKGYWKKSLKN
jgi:hypothetical protein